MAVRGVDHIDLAVSDVEASLAFYLGLLGPVGLKVEARFKTYRGTEDVFYLGFGQNHVRGAQAETRLGLRQADDGEHRYYEVGVEHLAFAVENRGEVDDAYHRCVSMVLGFSARLKKSTTWRAITPSLPSIPTGFASSFALGPTTPGSSGTPHNGHRKSRSCGRSPHYPKHEERARDVALLDDEGQTTGSAGWLLLRARCSSVRESGSIGSFVR
jgi:catechol 2,3-dioxygenase-like lactoylglutathione lyase family enzyme